MSRSETIRQILESRKPYVNKVRDVISKLNAVSDALKKFVNFLPEIPTETKNKIPELQNEISNFINVQIPSRIQDFGQIERRFGRTTLNIGVAGFPRQGKSTLLQALTGLTSNEIPSAEYNFCTGAPSMIVNRTGETTADIEFYTENDFFNEVIKPYYRELGLKPEPESFSNFIELPLPELTPENAGATAKGRYDRLIKILKQCKETKLPFGNATLREIKKEDIWNYIAQFDKEKKPLSNWIAVKMAIIYCQFSVQDVGKIVFCDTPGLGEVECGADENLIKNIGDNIDAIMILKRIPPGAVSLIHDTEMYDTIKRAIPELELKKWSHFIINKSNDDKQEGIDNFIKQLEHTHIEVRRYVTLDARNKNEVLTEFDKILNDVAESQKYLDDTLFEKRLENVKQLINEIKTFAEKLSTLFPQRQNIDAASAALAGALFNENNGVWDNLNVKLNELVEKFGKDREIDNQDYIKNLGEIEDYLKTTPGLPSNEEVKKKKGGLGYQAFHAFKCQAVRSDIIRTFETMDRGFKELFDQLRDEAKKCFIDDDGGKLAGVKYSDDNQQWWQELANDIAAIGQTEEMKKLAKIISSAIVRFSESTLSFRGLLFPRIFPCLDVLDTDNGEKFGPYAFKPGKTDEESVQNVIESINEAAKKAIWEACNSIRSFAKEPSMALYATIEELRNAVIKTEGENKSGQVWRDYYTEHRSDIWQDKFKKQEADAKIQKDWQIAVEKLTNKLNDIVTD